MAATAERLQDLVTRLSEDSATLVRSEIELAKAEVREKATALAKAAALGGIAAAVSLFGLFALVLLGVAGLAGLLALRSIKRGTPPVPQQAVAEAKAVAETLR